MKKLFTIALAASLTLTAAAALPRPQGVKPTKATISTNIARPARPAQAKSNVLRHAPKTKADATITRDDICKEYGINFDIVNSSNQWQYCSGPRMSVLPGEKENEVILDNFFDYGCSYTAVFDPEKLTLTVPRGQYSESVFYVDDTSNDHVALTLEAYVWSTNDYTEVVFDVDPSTCQISFTPPMDADGYDDQYVCLNPEGATDGMGYYEYFYYMSTVDSNSYTFVNDEYFSKYLNASVVDGKLAVDYMLGITYYETLYDTQAVQFEIDLEKMTATAKDQVLFSYTEDRHTVTSYLATKDDNDAFTKTVTGTITELPESGWAQIVFAKPLYDYISDTDAVEYTNVIVYVPLDLLKAASVKGIASEVDENAPVEYYNLQGVRVENPSEGLFIRRQGKKATKVILK